MHDLSHAPAEDIELPIEWLVSKGFPTFDEFKKNPDKWRSHHNELLDSVENSTKTFRHALTKQKYFWRTYEAKSIEHIERMAKEDGFLISDCEMEPIARPVNGTSQDGDVEIVIHFWPKDEFRAMGGIVSNDR